MADSLFKFLWDDVYFCNAPFQRVDMDLTQASLVDVDDLCSVALFLSLSCLPLNSMSFRLIYEILLVALSYCLKYLFFSAYSRTKDMITLFLIILCSLIWLFWKQDAGEYFSLLSSYWLVESRCLKNSLCSRQC